MLNIYNVLKLVEQEIEDMRKRQEPVIATYQQQTREELLKKMVYATEAILGAAENKVKELNSLEYGRPYIVYTNRHIVYIGVKRFIDEHSLHVSIDPIVHPSAFNLLFIVDEPSVALHNISASTGIVSINRHMRIRATDSIEQVREDDIEGLVKVWLNDVDESDARRILKGVASLRSLSTLLEYLLTSGKHTKKSTVYICNEHEADPMHKHDRMIPSSDVSHAIRYHLGI
jgi:hypothetical protein